MGHTPILNSAWNSKAQESKEYSCRTSVLRNTQSVNNKIGDFTNIQSSNIQSKSKVQESDELLVGRRPRLGTVLKDVNRRFLNDLEVQYSEVDKKHSPVALLLASVYIEGKRVTKDLQRAVEILNESSLAEAKFMLMKIAFQHENYSDAFHYLQFFSLYKWTWVEIKVKENKKPVKVPSKTLNSCLLVLEQHKNKCLKHEAEKYRIQIIDHLGSKQANKCYREGTSQHFHARNYSMG